MSSNTNKLIKLLKQAHAIEIGAYYAYKGHWKSSKNIEEKKKIQEIQNDELLHRKLIELWLFGMGSKPSVFLDIIFYIIGNSISISCFVLGRRLSAWGARIMETIGSKVYINLSLAALKTPEYEIASSLLNMAKTEREHEEFFRSLGKRS